MKSAESTAWQNFFSYLAYQFLLYIAASTSLYTNLLVSKAFRNEFRLFLHKYTFLKKCIGTNLATRNSNNNFIRRDTRVNKINNEVKVT